jgi:hypothetical protein
MYVGLNHFVDYMIMIRCIYIYSVCMLHIHIMSQLACNVSPFKDKCTQFYGVTEINVASHATTVSATHILHRYVALRCDVTFMYGL